MSFRQECYKCKGMASGEMVGDDDCRYIKFQCVPCKTKWTVNAPSVRPAAKPTEGDDDGSGKKKT